MLYHNQPGWPSAAEGYQTEPEPPDDDEHDKWVAEKVDIEADRERNEK